MAYCQSYSLVIVASCSAYPMQVDININVIIIPTCNFRGSNINHKDSISDINTSGHDVSTEQNIDLIIFESSENRFLFVDGHIDFFAILIDFGSQSSLTNIFQVSRLVSGEICSHGIKEFIEFFNLVNRVKENEDLLLYFFGVFIEFLKDLLQDKFMDFGWLLCWQRVTEIGNSF